METVLVLSADRWQLTDEKTGEIRAGILLHYVNQYREASDKAVGLRPTKISATTEVFDAIRKAGAPGFYKLDFRTRPGKESKPTLLAARAEFVRKPDLFEETAAAHSERKAR